MIIITAITAIIPVYAPALNMPSIAEHPHSEVVSNISAEKDIIDFFIILKSYSRINIPELKASVSTGF